MPNVSNCRICLLFFYTVCLRCVVLHFDCIYIGYCFKWIWHVVQLLIVFPLHRNGQCNFHHTEIDRVSQMNRAFWTVMQKLQHFRMCQSISVVKKSNTHTITLSDYFYANCQTPVRPTIPFIIASFNTVTWDDDKLKKNPFTIT